MFSKVCDLTPLVKLCVAGRFRVRLDCGHELVCDEKVNGIACYDVNALVRCYECNFVEWHDMKPGVMYRLYLRTGEEEFVPQFTEVARDHTQVLSLPLAARFSFG